MQQVGIARERGRDRARFEARRVDDGPAAAGGGKAAGLADRLVAPRVRPAGERLRAARSRCRTSPRSASGSPSPRRSVFSPSGTRRSSAGWSVGTRSSPSPRARRQAAGPFPAVGGRRAPLRCTPPATDRAPAAPPSSRPARSPNRPGGVGRCSCSRCRSARAGACRFSPSGCRAGLDGVNLPNGNKSYATRGCKRRDGVRLRSRPSQEPVRKGRTDPYPDGGAPRELTSGRGIPQPDAAGVGASGRHAESRTTRHAVRSRDSRPLLRPLALRRAA